MGSLGLPVQTKVLAGTEESSRPFRRAGDAQDALDIVAEADLEDTFSRKRVTQKMGTPLGALPSQMMQEF